MTHLWKSREIYTFDVPSAKRVVDVYWEANALHPIHFYLRYHNHKISNIRYDDTLLLVHIEIDIPKYPKEHDYFTTDDEDMLLKTWMDYLNATQQEIMEWCNDNSNH